MVKRRRDDDPGIDAGQIYRVSHSMNGGRQAERCESYEALEAFLRKRPDLRLCRLSFGAYAIYQDGCAAAYYIGPTPIQKQIPIWRDDDGRPLAETLHRNTGRP